MTWLVLLQKLVTAYSDGFKDGYREGYAEGISITDSETNRKQWVDLRTFEDFVDEPDNITVFHPER